MRNNLYKIQAACFVLALAFTFGSSSIFADTLYLKDGKEIKDAVVTEIDDSDVKYKIGERKVVYTVKKSKIAVIIYNDNTRETFGGDNKIIDEDYDNDTRESFSGDNSIAYDDYTRIDDAYMRRTFFTRNSAIEGSVGYIRAVIDGSEDYPLVGFGFNLGASGFIPLSDVVKFGGNISFNYFSASAKDDYDVELTFSGISLGITPIIRLGQDKTYADIGLGITIPFQEEVTLKVPGYVNATQKNKDTENTFALILSGRFEAIGFGISKVLTGSDKAVVLGAFPFISVTEQFEVVPSITYSMGNVVDELNLFIGFDIYF